VAAGLLSQKRFVRSRACYGRTGVVVVWVPGVVARRPDRAGVVAGVVPTGAVPRKVPAASVAVVVPGA